MESQAERDLALIRRIMEEGRTAVTDRGKHFILWGTLSAVGLSSTYLFALGRGGLDPALVWSGILVVGWAASLAIGFRDGRRARVVTVGRRMLSAVWICWAVSVTLVALAGMFFPIVGVDALPGLMAVLIGAPVLLTALLTGVRWLGWVAGAWWLGGAVMLAAPGLHTLPLMSAMALLLMALPGVLLYAGTRPDRLPDGIQQP